MGLKRCEAIVLKSQKLGEYDKIVTFLSREEGKLRGVAKGARKLKQRFGPAFEPYTHLKMEYFEKELADLVRIEHTEILHSQFTTRPEALGVLTCLTELIDGFAQERQVGETLFRLALASADALSTGDPRVVTVYFEIWLLKISGLLPSFSRCAACGREVAGTESLHVPPELGGLCCDRCAARRVETLGPSERRFVLDCLRTHPTEMIHSNRWGVEVAEVASSLHRYLRRSVEHTMGRKVRSYDLLTF